MLFQTHAHEDYDHLLPSMYKSHEILVYPQTWCKNLSSLLNFILIIQFKVSFYFSLCHIIRRQGLFWSDYIDSKYLYMRAGAIWPIIMIHKFVLKKGKKKQVYHHMIHWWQCMRYRSKLNSGLNFLTWVNSQFPLSARSPNYSWIRTRRQRKLRINKYIQITFTFSPLKSWQTILL